MLFAARLSAVTKKPRLRLTISRSSSVSPPGFFHSSMSRCMLISCGIQWFAQPARYLSHAHRYLNGTSWLTSAAPLITRLSSSRTRLVVVTGCWRSVSKSCTGSRESRPPPMLPTASARIVSGVARCAGIAGVGMSSSNVSIVSFASCDLASAACLGSSSNGSAYQFACYVACDLSNMGAAPGNAIRSHARSCCRSVHRLQLLVEELGREILAVQPGDRRQPVVEVELGEAVAVAKQRHLVAIQLVGQVDHALATIVEFEPDLVVTQVPRLDHVPRGLFVAGQAFLRFARCETRTAP